MAKHDLAPLDIAAPPWWDRWQAWAYAPLPADESPEALRFIAGDPRKLLLRPRGGGSSIAFTMGHGDLLVMGGSCQRTWEHAVPKTAHAGPRISVQFRPRNVL